MQNFRQQHVDYGQTVTDHYFPSGLWTAESRALPETVKGAGTSTEYITGKLGLRDWSVRVQD